MRSLVRDNVRASLPGADASVPNSVLRVLSDAQGGLCHLTLQYIDWLALQLLPDTAETEWLDRHGTIWLVNSDNTFGRKQATFASGTVAFSGTIGTVIPIGTILIGNVDYETTAQITLGSGPSEAPARAIDPGVIGNMASGNPLATAQDIPNVNAVAVVTMDGGVDVESDDDLRARILHRIRNPPMGGAIADYVTWALSVPGVTRAWAAVEQGIGTATVRFLMDELRADDDGWPTTADIQTVSKYIDTMRPVTVKDCYVVAPIKEFVDISIINLVPNTPEVQGEIEASVQEMLHRLAAPGQTIYQVWISYAIMNAPNVQSFTLVAPTTDIAMPTLGHMAVLGTILYDI